MFEVTKSFRFCAAHHNPVDTGPCRRNHGHNWEAQFRFVGTTLDERGWLVSFDQIKHEIQPTINSMDHQDLNEILPFNPSCELIAQHLHRIAAAIPLPAGVHLFETRVTERAGDWMSYAAYRP